MGTNRMKTFLIGRNPEEMDLCIEDDSLSRMHAELVVTGDGQYFLTDCASKNGTFRQEKGEWRKITQCYVTPDEPVLFGEFKTTIRALLNKITTPAGPDDVSCYYRNPETGEIIKGTPNA